MVAGSTQKSYGALDSYAEQNGREQAKRLRDYCDELHGLLSTLLQQASVQHLMKWAAALKRKVEQVELFIKRGLPMHVPSCADAEPADDAPTCPEHCQACAFGTADGDGSRARECDRKHTHRCTECAYAHSLQADFDALIKQISAAIEAATMGQKDDQCMECGDEDEDVAAAAAAAAADGGTAAAAVQPPMATWGGKDTFKDLSIAIQRALVRFKAFHAHERRAAHEAKIMEMLLRDLKVDGCIIVADWKVRESNSQRHEPV